MVDVQFKKMLAEKLIVSDGLKKVIDQVKIQVRNGILRDSFGIPKSMTDAQMHAVLDDPFHRFWQNH